MKDISRREAVSRIATGTAGLGLLATRFAVFNNIYRLDRSRLREQLLQIVARRLERKTLAPSTTWVREFFHRA
jgi:hypothetical protein